MFDMLNLNKRSSNMKIFFQSLFFLLCLVLGLQNLQSAIRYVKPTGTKDRNYSGPSSWNDAQAYYDIQEAILASQPGDQVWVAKGTYVPKTDMFYQNNPTNPRQHVYVIKEGISLYGGFPGIPGQEGNMNLRDIKLYETIISGDQKGNDFDPALDWPYLDWGPQDTIFYDNSFSLMRTDLTMPITPATVIDGFTFTQSNSLYFDSLSGSFVNPGTLGALFIMRGSPTIRNCTFKYNKGNNGFALGGGGIAVAGGNPKIEACTFYRNHAVGSGIYIFNMSSVFVDRCYFIDNYSDDLGVITIGNSNLLVTNSLFTDNGGSIGTVLRAYQDDNNISNVAFINNTIYGNKVGILGRIAYANSNTAPNNLVVSFINNILWNNGVPGPNNDGLFGYNNALILTQNNIIDYTYAHNMVVDPKFVSEPSNLSLQSTSPAIDASITTPANITHDILGVQRHNIPDIGCYEYIPTSIEDQIFQLLLKIYPNPTSDFIIVENLSNEKLEYEIFNVFGKALIKGTLSCLNNKIDLKRLSNGTYILKLSDNKRIKTEKIIISR